MPFEISPKPVEAPVVRKAPFGHYAEALLRGCAVSAPTTGLLCVQDERGLRACAIGALALGFGFKPGEVHRWDVSVAKSVLDDAYRRKYGTWIERDNDSRNFTREEIAARIAAL